MTQRTRKWRAIWREVARKLLLLLDRALIALLVAVVYNSVAGP